MMNVLQSGIASAERVFELLDADEQIARPGRAARRRREPARPGRVRPRVVLLRPRPSRSSRTSRSSPSRARPSPSSGPTGAGKTTLVNLIMRFYELDGGAITLDGRDIAHDAPPRAALEHRHGAPGHLAVRRHDPRQHRLRQPRRHRGADPRRRPRPPTSTASCTRCPTATTRVIDDEGGNVSAGEKQLLTIARAFLADPTILILDEATSSVDTRTEVLIQRGDGRAALATARAS